MITTCNHSYAYLSPIIVQIKPISHRSFSSLLLARFFLSSFLHPGILFATAAVSESSFFVPSMLRAFASSCARSIRSVMSKSSIDQPLLIVAGCTGTGKSDLGVAIAEKFNGEIISADSMQIYKGNLSFGNVVFRFWRFRA